MRVGVVGHRSLSTDGSVFAVRACTSLIAGLRDDEPRLVAVSALAEGADTIFARIAVILAVPLNAVQPHGEYLGDFRTGQARAQYRALWAAARDRTVMPYRQRSDTAYAAAMRWVTDTCDLLVAIWDGSMGATAQTVQYARACGRPVLHVNLNAVSVSIV